MTSVTAGTTSAVQGTDLQAGQHITTGADGRVHLMFVDGSAVTVGPNSTLRIESYSYDPASKTGAMTLDVQQGTIRFVGGAISKKADVQIRTPSSTVGIRGGIAAVSVSESGATSADFLHGSAMRVTAGGVTQTATRSGSQINVPVVASRHRPLSWPRVSSAPAGPVAGPPRPPTLPVGAGGTMSGSGTLTKTGSGTVVLTGSSTYTGSTTVSASTLTGISGGTLPKSGTLTFVGK